MRKMQKLVTAAVAGIMGASLVGSARADNATTTTGGSQDKGATAPHKGHNKCKAGKNACAGKGACATDKHACNGMNSCKGQGGDSHHHKDKKNKSEKKGNNSCSGSHGCKS